MFEHEGWRLLLHGFKLVISCKQRMEKYARVFCICYDADINLQSRTLRAIQWSGGCSIGKHKQTRCTSTELISYHALSGYIVHQGCHSGTPVGGALIGPRRNPGWTDHHPGGPARESQLERMAFKSADRAQAVQPGVSHVFNAQGRYECNISALSPGFVNGAP